jgi:MATE family multidrug resistance protein
MWIALIVVGSLSGASAINMSLRLGNMNPTGARQAGMVGIGMSACILVVLGALIFFQSRLVASIFTEDVVFLDMFAEASLPFTLTLIFMNLAVAIERIPYAMGRTREIFWMGFVASWGGQVPGVILMTKYWRADLVGLYYGMAIGYAMLCVLYGIITFRRYVRRMSKVETVMSTIMKETRLTHSMLD